MDTCGRQWTLRLRRRLALGAGGQGGLRSGPQAAGTSTRRPGCGASARVAVVLGGHGDGLACVGHADLDFLGGDHDAAPRGDPPLHWDAGWGQWGGTSQADALQPVPLAGPDRAGQGAPQHTVLGDDVHQLAVKADPGPLPGQRGADQDQLIAQRAVLRWLIAAGGRLMWWRCRAHHLCSLVSGSRGR